MPELLVETKYPFVVSTRAASLWTEHLDLSAQCNCVLQISMVCRSTTASQRGCRSYEERLQSQDGIGQSANTIVRIQPYMPEVFHDVTETILASRMRQLRRHREGMKFFSGPYLND